MYWTTQHGPLQLLLLPSGYGTSLYRDPLLLVTSGGQDWRFVQTCSPEEPPPNWYLHLVATKAHTVGKRVVCILLECFLVTMILWYKIGSGTLKTIYCFPVPQSHTFSRAHKHKTSNNFIASVSVPLTNRLSVCHFRLRFLSV